MIAASSDGAALVGVLFVYLLVMVGLTVACGFWAKSIMIAKGRSGSSGFCLGFFLGLLGVLIAALLSPTPEHELRKQQQLMSMMGGAAGYRPYPPQAGIQAQAGQWATDPFGRHQLRYHDGLQWTDSVSNNGATGFDPPGNRAPAIAAGQWAADPYQRHELRYFDGSNWTRSVSNGGVTSTDPIG